MTYGPRREIARHPGLALQAGFGHGSGIVRTTILPQNTGLVFKLHLNESLFSSLIPAANFGSSQERYT